jgi:hypothetical protein
LAVLVGGHHILYSWYNLLAQWLLGENYFSPVFMNVMLTFGTGFLLCRYAIGAGLSHRYAKGLYVFFLLHWELLSWTSLVNLKESLVLFMTVATIYVISRLAETRHVVYLFPLSLLMLFFYWLRFYVPLLLILSIFIHQVMFSAGRRRIVLMAIFGALVWLYMLYVGSENILESFRLLKLGNAVDGGFKVALTPRPWSIDPEYSFLTVPSLLHWLLFLPAIYGGIRLWLQVPRTRLLLIYCVVALLLYGAFEELQGPRHRLQLLFVYGWAQYHFFCAFLRRNRKFSTGRPSQIGGSLGIVEQ